MPRPSSIAARAEGRPCRPLAVAFAALVAVLLLLPSLAAAQLRKTVVFDADDPEASGGVIIGYVHKPEVGYIITRQEQEDLETLQLKESFVPKIVKSVESKPF